MPPDPAPSSPPPARFTRTDLRTGAAIFLLLALVFGLSPVSYVTDSRFCLLLSESLLTRHTFLLDDYGIPRYPPGKNNDADVNGFLYEIEVRDGHFYHYFPPGASILSLPYVAVMDGLGQGLLDRDGHYDLDREIRLQRQLAAWLMAGSGVIFYFTARLLLSMSWSAGLALGASLGTQIWSTASRGVWGHTWGLVLIGAVIYLLLARETGRRRRLPSVLLATLLSWTYFVRPTNCVFILGVTVYVALYQREIFLAYALTGAAWFAGFVAWSHHEFGQWLPSYYRASRLDADHFREAFVGNLISPSRGLLVMVPVAWCALFLIVRHWRALPHRRLLVPLLVAGLAQLLAVACFNPWYGGGCFGPRYSSELVPTGLLGCALGLTARRGKKNVPLAIGGVLLMALSAWINGRGALAPTTLRWNLLPISIDAAPARVWDWSYPQWLAGILPVPVPDTAPKLAGRLDFGLRHPESQNFQSEGWSNRDDFACTVGPRAELFFAMDDPAAVNTGSLRLNVTPVLSPPKVVRQRLEIELNGQRVGAFTLTDGARTGEIHCPLPPGTLHARNRLVLRLPDAPNARGVQVYWLEVDAATDPAR